MAELVVIRENPLKKSRLPIIVIEYTHIEAKYRTYAQTN